MPRVHELALEFGVTSKEILARLKDLGEFVKSASSTVEPAVARRLRDSYRRPPRVVRDAGERRTRVADTASTDPPDRLTRRIANLVADEKMTNLLAERLTHSQIAVAAGAHQLPLVSIMSVVEGLLSSHLPKRQRTLQAMIEAAHDKGLIQFDARAFLHAIRNLRNLIHPEHHLAENGFVPDHDTVTLC
jgi:hypothetical protein